MDRNQLEDVLHRHKLWLDRKAGGCAADLYGSDLRGVYLKGADLRGADLRRVNLAGACLIEADFRGANLTSANLEGAYLARSDFRGANLSAANLRVTNLSETNLDDATLCNATMCGTIYTTFSFGGHIVNIVGGKVFISSNIYDIDKVDYAELENFYKNRGYSRYQVEIYLTVLRYLISKRKDKELPDRSITNM